MFEMQHNSLSESALSVAIQLLLLYEDKQWGHLVSNEVVEATSRLIRHIHHPITQKMASARFRHLLRRWNHWVLPYFSVHLALRKKWIERETKKSLQQGIEQVIVLGAGFDTLAYRLHRLYSDVEWIEIDLPHTQSYKQEAMKGLTEKNLQLLPADLSHDSLHEVLSNTSRYRFDHSTLFIAEGVLMYLHPFAVKRLLETISQCSERGSMLIGSALEPQKNDQLDLKGTKWLIRWLSQRNEPYRWGIAAHHLSQFIAHYSFNLIMTLNSPQIAPTKLRSKLPKGEYFFLATKE